MARRLHGRRNIMRAQQEAVATAEAAKSTPVPPKVVEPELNKFSATVRSTTKKKKKGF